MADSPTQAPASHIATQETGKPVWLLMKRGLYERPGHQGYTGLRVDAGRFTLDEARRMEEHSAGEVSMVHENTAAPLAPRADRGTFAEVLAQRLDEANAALSSAERRNEELVTEGDGASGREDEAAVATTPAPTLDGAERR